MDHVCVVYNARSGAQLDRDRLARLFERRGVKAQLRAFDPDSLTADVRELLATGPDALLVAGGDGSVRAVAERMLGSEVPLGIVPGGTMNVLARDLGVPNDLDEAVDALLSASVAWIDVATVNDQIFLCSSMLALMPHIGRLRERARSSARGRLGLLRNGLRILRRYPRMRLTIVVDGQEHPAHTRAAVVSCNPLAAGPAPLPGRDRLDAGTLAVYVTHDRTRWDLLTVAARLFDGSWQRDARIRVYEGTSVRIRTSSLRYLSVMSDGEIAQLGVPLRYEIRPRALAVLAP
ncbi:diacylglycerol/lipid kinase family protein [Dactylosporangium sp. CA-052675]|uniref:diacylglycerol/lipid kinase family protein n=1 Tax=Dactylosporangium sp. CA-052675 TaxID=3239927 RepID=UPI003D8D1EE0